MSTVLVTGGAGFIGSHISDQLALAGHQVVVFDDLSGGRPENVRPPATLVEGTILDHGTVEKLFAQHRFAYVFHCAAFAAECLSHHVKRFTYATNVVGSANLINEAVKHRCGAFVFTSSIAVYGDLPPPVDEDSTPRPQDPYGISKLAIEQDLAATRRLFGMPYIVFRLHNVYGSRQNCSDRYRNVIGIFMREALAGREMPVFGDGGQTRAFTHVSDAASAIAQSVDCPAAYNEIFNLGAEEATSVLELSRMVAEALNVPWRVRYEDARHEVRHAFANHAKARRLLDYRARTEWCEGLTEMAAGIKQDRSHEPGRGPPIELPMGLPRSWR